MNRIKLFLIAIVSSTVFFSCKKDDDSTSVAPPRDRAEQYAVDMVKIEEYLHTHYLTVTTDANNNPISTITPIPTGGTQVSIWDQTEYPLQFKMIKNDTRIYSNTDLLVGKEIEDAVDYKVYYLKLRQGIGQAPTRVDSTLIAYRGTLLDGDQFDYRPNPVWLVQESMIPGWRNIMTEFKTGNIGDDPSNPGGTLFTDYGVGIMFLPSGLGYFNGTKPGVGSYAPLVFQFNLHNLKFRDSDKDGILSYLEDLNANGNYYDDDTDGDGVPNFLDIDDDGDGVRTREEIKDDFGNLYEFDAIPNCAGSTGGLKRHLDPSCE